MDFYIVIPLDFNINIPNVSIVLTRSNFEVSNHIFVVCRYQMSLYEVNTLN